MSISGRLFAAVYDRMMARTERDGLSARRDALLAQAAGGVLEIGGGTGVNLARYGAGVESLTLIEPEPAMARRLEAHVAERRPGTRIVMAAAEELPFDEDTFDTAVSTLVLCTVRDQPRALQELRRVLKPGGNLLFIEHVRSDDPRVAKWQDRLLAFNRLVAHGCHCNRATLEGIQDAGFEVTQLERGALVHAPPHLRPLVAGVAKAPA